GRSGAMPTYISMLNWSGSAPHAIRKAINERSEPLRTHGLNSVVFLPEKGACAAVMISTCRDIGGTGELAREIAPRVRVRVESMLFDDGPSAPPWLRHRAEPILPEAAARSLLHDILELPAGKPTVSGAGPRHGRAPRRRHRSARGSHRRS